MADVDNSTLQEVDLDKAFEGNGKEAKPGETNSAGEQTVELDINSFLAGLDPTLTKQAEPEKKEVKAEDKEEVKSEEAKPEEPAQEQVEETPADEVKRLKDEVETLKKRYSDSSKEGKKVAELEKRIADLEPKAKVYDQIVADPNLENMVVNYWQKGSNEPSGDLKKELGLSDDFMFDPDDIAKPGTDSYKLFQESVQRAARQIVDKRFEQLQQQNEKKIREAKIEQMKNAFVEKYGSSAYDEVQDYMKDKVLTIEDIYKLMTFSERDKTIARNAATQQSEQVKKNQGREPSLATAKSANVPKSAERQVMDALKMIDGGDFSF